MPAEKERPQVLPKYRLSKKKYRSPVIMTILGYSGFGLVYNSSRKKKCGRLPSPSDVGLTKVFERMCLYGRICLILVGLYL